MMQGDEAKIWHKKYQNIYWIEFLMIQKILKPIAKLYSIYIIESRYFQQPREIKKFETARVRDNRISVKLQEKAICNYWTRLSKIS
jgi:hypothetical protein